MTYIEMERQKAEALGRKLHPDADSVIARRYEDSFIVECWLGKSGRVYQFRPDGLRPLGGQ